MRKLGCLAILFLGFFAVLGHAEGGLKMGFYNQSCPKAEKILARYVKKHISRVPSLAAALLRLHFHDCFVRGCDASVLLNSTSRNRAEKNSKPNNSLRGFHFIDRLKRLLESACPGIVSCADILSLAARDAIVVTGGPFWRVPTGRRDGRVSNYLEAKKEIPAPFFNFSALEHSFKNKGLNVTDLVVLSGAHTIGISHCAVLVKRLYNFSGGAVKEDPSLDSEYAAVLRKTKCKRDKDSTTLVEMDPGSHRTFDLSYYQLLLKRRGLFQSDAALTTDPFSTSYIRGLLNAPLSRFYHEFGLSMEKMGRIGVKTGSEGEIRKHCALVNT
ncbi:hypothetical protein ACLOJK_039577 [Asimina triloba]